MSNRHYSSSEVCRKRGSALVIALATLVLICTIVLAFFEKSKLHRQISFSSAGQFRADVLAHTALNTIVGDLRSEIAAGSTNSINGLPNTVNNIAIYQPTTHATAVPCQVGNQGFANLVAQSTSISSFWTGSDYNSSIASPTRAAANNSTATPSANGRYIQVNAWNKPGLLCDPGSGKTPQVPTAPYTPPDWILMTRQGAITNATAAALPSLATLADQSGTNSYCVIGRFAYAIYNEGGLMDVNVAGYPSSLAGSDFPTKRGGMPQVDLGNIPGIVDANGLVQWRNQTTAASASSYKSYVMSATNGFTTAAPGDQAFISRRDLINYIQNNPAQVQTSALQYLGTFSRELNAPSYTPNSARPRVMAGDGYRLAVSPDPGSVDDLFNPSLVNQRVTTSFTRASDGTTAQKGEPLLKYRFPLSRLSWIGYNGPNGATAAQIKDAFGLTWANGVWIYNHGRSDAIIRLADVANGIYGAPREPDFFELLQAAINIGSLGKGSSNSATSASAATYDINTYLQIIQIGANLFDQYDADSYPTRLSLNSIEITGIENLPYLVQVYYVPYRYLADANGPDGKPDPATGLPYIRPTVGLWAQPVIWNPHAQYSQTTATAGPAPTQFRFTTTGTSGVYVTTNGSPSITRTGSNNTFPNPLPDSSYGITFTAASSSFSRPTILTSSNAVADNPVDNINEGGVSFIALRLGTVFAPDSRLNPADPVNPADASLTTQTWMRATPYYSPNFTHQLQYWDGTQWVTYNRMKYLRPAVGTSDRSGLDSCFRTYIPRAFSLRGDPRTDRFGISYYFTSPDYTKNETSRPGVSAGYSSIGLKAFQGWTPGTTSSGIAGLNLYSLGLLSENKPSTDFCYADPDGVYRLADGAYANGNLSDGGYPLVQDASHNQYTTPDSRPIILNRPFRSVADMGYAFRDMPWKHLDFMSANSGDAALLDVFCLNESPQPPSPTVSTDPVAAAGRLDLNTRQQPVLKAALLGAVQSEPDGTTLSASDADALAAKLISLTSGSAPLLNRSELVTRWISDTTSDPYASKPDSIIKRRREAAVRALADIGNTRTWNLLIDVIAQSGRYAPGAANLDQFIVGGQRRYWLHVAIDRYTGKVVAQSLEPIYE